MEITLGGMKAEQPTVKRMAMLIWGPAGIGKTTFACTAQGRKALISFDPDGAASVAGFDDVNVFDMASMPDHRAAGFKQTDFFGIEKTVEHFDTYIIDSLSTIADKALAYAISITKGATIERPSPGAYGARNNLVIALLRDLLAITAKHNKHIIFTAHEGSPEKDDANVLIGYTLSLGGKLPSETALRINEVWPMFEDSKNRKFIICRKSRMREPAKSRMFDTAKQSEFEWKFDPANPTDGVTIAKLYQQWEDAGFQKIQMPK